MAYTPYPIVPGTGGGGEGVSVHNSMTGRSTYPAHVASAIQLNEAAINEAGAGHGWTDWNTDTPHLQQFAEIVAAQGWGGGGGAGTWHLAMLAIGDGYTADHPEITRTPGVSITSDPESSPHAFSEGMVGGTVISFYNLEGYAEAFTVA